MQCRQGIDRRCNNRQLVIIIGYLELGGDVLKLLNWAAWDSRSCRW